MNILSFQKENFIIEVVSKEVRQFLEWFTETQMFEMFMDQQIEKTDAGASGMDMLFLLQYKILSWVQRGYLY